MTYRSTLAKRLKAGVAEMLAWEPENSDQDAVKHWLVTGKDKTSVVWLSRSRRGRRPFLPAAEAPRLPDYRRRAATRAPSGTAPPVIIGWIGQTVLNEDFDSRNFKNGLLGQQGAGIIAELEVTNAELITSNQGPGAVSLVGENGAVDTFESTLHVLVDPGAVGKLGIELQQPTTPSLKLHHHLTAAWVFQSLVVEDPMTVAVAKAPPPDPPELYVSTLGENLLSHLEHVPKEP